MSRSRDSQAKSSWSRKYHGSGQVGMGTSSRAGGAAPPPLTAEALRAHHDKPFGVNQKPSPDAGKRTLHHSGSGSMLPSLAKHASMQQTDEPIQPTMQISYSSPNLMQAMREHQIARTASTTNLVHSFHAHHTQYQFLVQRLTADLDSLLERTRDPKLPADDQELNKERADGCMMLMKQLAAASPNSSTFSALAEELHLALHNTSESGGIEYREYDPTEQMTFWQLARLLQGKCDGITKELGQVQARANYYAFHESAERDVLIRAMDKWRTHLRRMTFIHWRKNVRRARSQREKLATMWSQFESRQAKAKITKCFLLWKFQRVRTHRSLVGPQLISVAEDATRVDTETTDTNRWINQATNALKDLTTKLHAFNAEKSKLTEELSRLQTELSSFKALKLQDVAHYTLDTARELLLSLQDEIEFYADPNGPFTHDGYRVIQPFTPPTKEAEKKARAAAKKKAKDKGAVASAIGATDTPTPTTDDAVNNPPPLDSLLMFSAAISAASGEQEWDALALEARFAAMSDQDVLLQWFNLQLTQYHYRAVPNYDEYQLPLSKRLNLPPPTVCNFSTDFASTRGLASQALLMVLETVAPLLNYRQSMNYLLHHELDVDLRARNMLNIICDFNTDLGDMLPLDTLLLAKAPDLQAAMIAKLFSYYPNLPMSKDALAPCLQRLEAMKLERRIVFSRLTNISLKHLEFDQIYISARRDIEISRLQANRFLRNMNRSQLLKVHLSNEWNVQAKEEEAARRAEQAAAEEAIRKLEAEQAAIDAAEKAALEEAVRRAKVTLGLPSREMLPDANTSMVATIEEEVDEEGEGDDAAVTHASSDPSATPVPKKKTRKQLALDFEKSRLAHEEASLAKAAATQASAPMALDPFSPEEALIYVNYIQKFAVEYHALYAEARKHMERIRRGEQMYRNLQKRMENFVVDVLVRRVNQDPLPIIDHKAHRDYAAFTNLSVGRLHDLLPTDGIAASNELLQLQGELSNDYWELCSVFRAYSRVDHATDRPLTDSLIVAQGCLLMHSADFAEMIRDLKLLSRSIKQAHVDDIFEQCIIGSSVASTMALSPNQFTEAIVRLSVLKYSMSCLSDSVALFLKQDLFKRCKKISPDLLRSNFKTQEYLDLLRKHRRKIRKVFLTYAAGNGHNQSSSPSAERNTIDLKDFASLLKFAKQLGGGEGLSMEDVTCVFVNVKRAEYITCDNPPSDPEQSRLDYSEFCQALAALATYKNPDPFTGFFTRFDHFLTRDFLPSNK